MCTTLIALYAAWRAAVRNTWPYALAAGVACGLALDTKLNAFFLIVIVPLWVALSARRAWLKLAVGYTVAAPLTLYLAWPWLWFDPVTRFAEYVGFHMTHYPVAVMYLGHGYLVAPWHYSFVMTAVTTPPATLVLALAGTALAARKAWRERREPPTDVSSVTAQLALILIALGANFLFSALPFSRKYGGVRLFLPVFPLLALLATYAAAQAAERIGRPSAQRADTPGRPRWLVVAVCAVVLALSWRSTALAHPWQLSYYNALIGGTRGADRVGMELSYWGETYSAAVDFLNRNTPPGGCVWVWPPGYISLLECHQHIGWMRGDIRMASGPELPPDAVFGLFQNRAGEIHDAARCLWTTGSPVHSVELGGARLMAVYGPADLARCRQEGSP
jgi:hypothetical protein